jgi:cystathionine beta-lyase
MRHHPFDDVTLDELRARKSAKWTLHASDVLPAWGAEMDYPLAEPIRQVLQRALRVDLGDSSPRDLGAAFAGWAEARWGWRVAEGDVRLAVDVVTAIAEVLSVATAPGDGVVIDPPVYPPFAATIRRLGRRVVEAALLRASSGWALDLQAIEDAYRAGARAHVFCSPHNPSGTVYPRDALVALGALAEKHGVFLLSDEVHAPLTLPGATHLPFASVSDSAAARAIVVSAASKTWNLQGLKTALIVASSNESRAVLRKLPADISNHVSYLGALAARSAFQEGEPWRQLSIAILDRNRHLLSELLRRHLPGVGYVPPRAGYLTWLDFRERQLGDDPARVLLERGRVALTAGSAFGQQGIGHARLNIGTSRALLEEAVRRMALALR